MHKIKKISKNSEKRAMRKWNRHVRFKKFKNWLIKKLGGYTSNELKEPYAFVHYSRDELVTINSQYRIDIEEFHMMGDESLFLETIQCNLADDLLSRLTPEFIFDKDLKLGLITIKARMTLPSKYVKGVTNEENNL